MADFDSSYDFGEEVTGGSDFETVDISDSEDKVDVESEAEIWIDASEETDVEVPISSEDEMMIDVSDETDTDSIVYIGDFNIDDSVEDNIGDSTGDEKSDVEIDEPDIKNPGEISIDEADGDVNSIVNVDESNASKSIEGDTEQETEDIVVNNEELREYMEKESPYSMEVNKYISSPEELQVYKEAGLVERNIDGRVCLIREDLDLDYVDKQSGLTNAELIAKGRSPYDAKTGERIELHHIGQDFNAPFAELQSVSEHDIYSKTLHKSEMDSWRRDPEKVRQYNTQRKIHWKNRV